MTLDNLFSPLQPVGVLDLYVFSYAAQVCVLCRPQSEIDQVQPTWGNLAIIAHSSWISIGRFGPDLVKVTARALQASHAIVFHFGCTCVGARYNGLKVVLLHLDDFIVENWER